MLGLLLSNGEANGLIRSFDVWKQSDGMRTRAFRSRPRWLEPIR